jgi:hypothetical protein
MSFPYSESEANPRKKLVVTCSQVLINELSIIEAARIISSLRHEDGIDANDENILVFVGIDSETDHLPIGEVRRSWNQEALVAKDKEIKDYEKKVQEDAFDACKFITITY